MKVAGVDACSGGWVVVILVDGGFAGATLYPTFGDVLTAHEDTEIVAVDIPIGPPERRPREADVQARKYLRGQASTAWPTPPAASLLEDVYQHASSVAHKLTGKRLSRQSFGMRKRILEVDGHAREDERIWEIHPEVSFRAMNDGKPIPYRKKSWNGQMLRRELLERVGIGLPTDLGPAAAVPPDDVLDAAAAAWSAQRIAARNAASLPDPPEVYPDGRRVAIWY